MSGGGEHRSHRSGLQWRLKDPWGYQERGASGVEAPHCLATTITVAVVVAGITTTACIELSVSALVLGGCSDQPRGMLG